MFEPSRAVSTPELAFPTARFESQGFQTVQRLSRHRAALVSALVLAALVVVALLAPLIATHDPVRAEPGARFVPPSAGHFFGTDHLGRDVFSRVVYGTRISLRVGLSAVAVAVTLGLLLGMPAGYYGSFLDSARSRRHPSGARSWEM